MQSQQLMKTQTWAMKQAKGLLVFVNLPGVDHKHAKQAQSLQVTTPRVSTLNCTWLLLFKPAQQMRHNVGHIHSQVGSLYFFRPVCTSLSLLQQLPA